MLCKPQFGFLFQLSDASTYCFSASLDGAVLFLVVLRGQKKEQTIKNDLKKAETLILIFKLWLQLGICLTLVKSLSKLLIIFSLSE